MPSVTQPEHDAFFKRSLQNKAIAIDFFKAHLPADILKRIDFSSLKLTEKSFVAKDLKQLQNLALSLQHRHLRLLRRPHACARSHVQTLSAD